MKQLAVCFLLLVGFAAAQVDEVVYNQETKRLSYVIDYDRILENADSRGCEPETFENSLLHTVLRTLFLYLPYEASFYPDVAALEVRVMSEDALVLYATAPLNELRDTNSRFRIFMNSFASSRSGFCFAVESEVLESWMSTLTARGGRIALDTEMMATRLEGLQDIAGLEVPALGEAAAITPGLRTEPVAVQPEPIAAPEPVAQTAAPRVQTVNGYSVVPYLSGERKVSFTEAAQVLKANTDYVAVIETNKGTLTIDLLEGQAPVTVNNFIFLALNQYYEGVSIFRVIDGFIAQTGDPTGTGVGGPGYQFANEISPGFSHSTAGVVSMANAGPDTNGSQFFITLASLPSLDGSYTIFAAVIDGLDVLDKLTRTDPTAPITFATLDSTLGLLETQGITLGGSDRETLEGFITRTLGGLPELAQRFSVGSYDAIIGSDGENLTVAFWRKSDVIQHVYILERPR